jgi:rhamnose utilization protein RhaD (predicted bifunctional aldolase and dehydrogenase)
MNNVAELQILAVELGREDRGLALFGEGNVSARASDQTFWVSASHSFLGQTEKEDLVECRFDKVLSLLDRTSLEEAGVSLGLAEARIKETEKKPSSESLFHAYLLTLPGVSFVAHTHPISVNQIICSGRAKEFAENRMFPEEIIQCGASSLFVPYKDPGLPLAQSLRRLCEGYIQKHGVPRVILLENHGAIVLGSSAHAVLNATLILEKAAQIWNGAANLGGPKYLHIDHIRRIQEKTQKPNPHI